MKNSQVQHFLIIGQGLAGSVLAYLLLEKGQQVTLIDKGHKGSSTELAAGVVNPVTGRRLVKSWMIDDLLPVAKTFYQELGQHFDTDIWFDLPALKLFSDTTMENNWTLRMLQSGYESYLDMATKDIVADFPVKANHGVGIIQQAARANVSWLIEKLRRQWVEKAVLREEAFDVTLLDEARSEYQGMSYDKIIFCEGWEAIHNPYFRHLPFQPSKGEVLLIRIPNMPEHRMIKKKVAFIPLGQQIFWVGATYFWDYEDGLPTENGRRWLLEEIETVLDTPFEIIDHRAAIRPTVKQRRPFIGQLSQHPTIGIFNGFGTKGTSLIPYWAAKYVDNLVIGRSLSKEVDVNRYSVE